MALTAGFGQPPPRRPSRQEEAAAATSPIRFRRVLSVAVRQGTGAVWLPIAIADNDRELGEFQQLWAADPRNQQIFLGQTKITLTPDLSQWPS